MTGRRMMLMKQICFPTDDDYIVCNGIYRNGVFIPAKNKWYKFKCKKRKIVK